VSAALGGVTSQTLFVFIRVSIGAEETFRNVHSGVVFQSGIIDFMF